MDQDQLMCCVLARERAVWFVEVFHLQAGEAVCYERAEARSV